MSVDAWWMGSEVEGLFLQVLREGRSLSALKFCFQLEEKDEEESREPEHNGASVPQ